MCDTFVILGTSTDDGSVILGKNSDREPNEAQELVIYPAADYAEGSQVQCTYISIPQVSHTHAVLLSRPFWMWGAEMGMNEHGVAIGNEAIFTRVPYKTGPGLIGMDFLRLALERAATAQQALNTITGLLEHYGQSGNCGFTHPFYYHNSFLIADSREAWVLETAGEQWVAKNVKGIYSISNAATIGANWDLASADLIPFALERGWCKGSKEFHFARCYSDWLYTTLSDARSRAACTSQLLAESGQNIGVRAAMKTLRSHGLHSPSAVRLDRNLLGSDVCMHAGAGPVRGSQSVGSLVAHITSEFPTAWVTGTSAPCTGTFKPVWIDTDMPFGEPSPTGKFDPSCMWWRHERLHRAVLQDYPHRIGLFEEERDKLEEGFVTQVSGSTAKARQAYSEACFRTAEQAEDRWFATVEAHPVEVSNYFYYTAAWKNINRQANMDKTNSRN